MAELFHHILAMSITNDRWSGACGVGRTEFAIWGFAYVGRAREFRLQTLPLIREVLAHSVGPNMPKKGMNRQGKLNTPNLKSS